MENGSCKTSEPPSYVAILLVCLRVMSMVNTNMGHEPRDTFVKTSSINIIAFLCLHFIIIVVCVLSFNKYLI